MVTVMKCCLSHCFLLGLPAALSSVRLYPWSSVLGCRWPSCNNQWDNVCSGKHKCCNPSWWRSLQEEISEIRRTQGKHSVDATLNCFTVKPSIRFVKNDTNKWPSKDKSRFFTGCVKLTFWKYESCPLIQTLICSSALLWLCLRPAEIGGTRPPLSHLQGDAVNQDAGWQPGPDAAAEGDPWWQSGHHHHRCQRLCLLSHPQEGQLSQHQCIFQTCMMWSYLCALQTATLWWDFFSLMHLGNFLKGMQGFPSVIS